MRSFSQLALVAALLLQSLPTLADDVITNVMSPIVSFQYPDNFSSQALTNGGISSPVVSFNYFNSFNEPETTIVSPIVSYQYYEWPGDDVLQLSKSRDVSYYFPFFDSPLLISPTERLATLAEQGGITLPPPPPSQLKLISGGVILTDAALAPNIMTIVLTHGWIPTIGDTEGINGWPKDMAAQLEANGINNANIVGWDWADEAQTILPGKAANQTAKQGIALGQALLAKLGPDYSQPIHFVGHSFGTLVNAYAANFLHGDKWASEPTNSTPWANQNTHMTLFDEAEVGTELTTLFQGLDLIAGMNGNPFSPKPSYYHPLPKQSRWADNYVSGVGLLHTNAANVILTNNFPADAPTLVSWIVGLANFHGYPIDWYDETIQTDISAMGFRWSFERGGFAGAPATNSVYVQSFAASHWNLALTNWNYGTNLLADRFEKYRSAVADSLANETPGLISANGSISGQNIVGALPALNSFLLHLVTTSQNAPAPQRKIHSSGAGDENQTNVPAYAWMDIVIPPNAVSLSFDYKIHGDWMNDSLAAALNGTNVLLISGNQIETNTTFNSGQIDVTALAGQTNEFFVGIVGGTSVNAELVVMNLAFYVAPSPTLDVQVAGGDLKLTWPLSASFGLESTTNLADINSWTPLTNVPAIVDLQNAVTNSTSGEAKFYRLKK